jgi:hypothetical protein
LRIETENQAKTPIQNTKEAIDVIRIKNRIMSNSSYRITALLSFSLVNLLFNSIPVISQTISNKHEVLTQITIKSSPAEVWSMLTDVEKYPEWHPYIKKIEGKLDRKSKIKVTYKKSDTEDGVFSAYMLDNEVNKKLSWGGSLGFIFRAKHYYIIEAVGADSVKLIQGEYWRGILGGIYGKKIYENTTRKFELMNNKLKYILENVNNRR